IVKRRRRKRREPTVEASYVCDVCGEEIVIPIVSSAGESQEFIEDCPVRCHPQVIRVEIDDDGEVRAWSAGDAS
ncbi:MAG TPA: CPXCG motif-containing cysteine-rich protein, partial [Planctomycetaceae bacterium]|nr:CPXCG motif-containing cysteine-rich protein [Planctomycetaceae bacterium]